MKVLTIINSLATGGAEKLILDTVPFYNKKGIVVDVLVFQDDKYPFYRKLKESATCSIYNLNSSSVYNPISIFKMMRILKKYDIAHVHLFPAQYFVVLAKLLSFSKIKLIFTEHNTTNRRLEKPFFRLIDKWIYRFYTKVVAISSKIETIIKTHTNLTAERIVVIENGVAIQQIIKANAINKKNIDKKIQPSDTLILMVAGFREQKDQETLIKAMPLLPSNCKLVFAGIGITKQRCLDLVAQLKIDNQVVFLGIRDDIPNLLKTSDIVVLSSHHEGMSLSSIEGLASGKPFVASNVPGLTEVVEGAGLLFKDNDEVGLANHINKLLLDQTYYNQIASQCQERAKNYDIEIMIQKHIDLYKSIFHD